MPDLTYSSVIPPISAQDGSNHFEVNPVEGTSHKFGYDSNGFPKFFVRTDTSSQDMPNIIRELLSVEFDVFCKYIDEEGNSSNGHFSIITLRDKDDYLCKYFVDIFTLILSKLSPKPAKLALSIEIERVISIFSALQEPPKKTLQGLWAELLVIESSHNPDTMVEAWHSDTFSKYDFSLGTDKLEVKSASGEERVHSFSLDQLNPSPNSRLLIASVFVRESGASSTGLSVKDLYDRICRRIDSVEKRIRLYEIIAKTLGNSLSKCGQNHFDYTSATDSLRFYNHKDIPAIDRANVPDNVTCVKFMSNLSYINAVAKDNQIMQLGLYQCL